MAYPTKYDYGQICELLEKYIEETTIPVITEFAYKNNIRRQLLYERPELADAIKKLIDKKEAQLEILALNKKIDKSMAIFSLKQLGWRDNIEIKSQLTDEELKTQKEMIKQFIDSNS